jgi:hypothetical protein
MDSRRSLALVIAGAFLAGCGSGARIHTAGPCRDVPPIPKLGSTGSVALSPVPDISGYRVRFRNRDWQAAHVAVRPTPFSGQAVVVSASPFPALRVTRPGGPALTLPLLPVACA